MSAVESSPSVVLLQRAHDGSGEALGALFDVCGERLLALIRLRLGRTLRRDLESRDILQATFLKGIERFDQFEGSGSRTLMGWLATIARNETRDHARYLQRHRRDARARVSWHSSLQVADSVASEVSRIQLHEKTCQLEAALHELAEDHREVLLLRQYEELSFAEVGAHMGRSEDAARMLYARALAALTVKMRGAKN